jgi:protein phosphatase
MPALVPLEVAWKTHQGMVRERNEDSCMAPTADTMLLQERGYLFAVADGMGGYRDGHEASQVSLTTLYEQFYSAPITSLPDAIQSANMAVRRLSMQSDRDARMGTTLVAALFRGDSVLVAHVGDSRAYLVRQAVIQQVTSDHSIVQEQVHSGQITREQADASRGKNVITRSIGNQSAVQVDYTPISGLQAGDTLVLCSDGLSNQVADVEIAQAVTSYVPDQAAEALVQLANQRGGFDNITVQIIRVNALPFTGSPALPLTGIAIPERKRSVSTTVLVVLGLLLLVAIVSAAVIFFQAG